MIAPFPPLADTLGWLLPDVQDTLLLRACLSDAASAAVAWDAWLAMTTGMPKALAERPQSRRFLPLLHHALNAHDIALSEPALSILRAATLWEERRATRVRGILIEVLACLRRAGVSVVLLKGTALAETAYPEFRLRHCHDLDLLVEEAALPEAGRALAAAGFLPAVAGREQRVGRSLAMRHADGLPANLHTSLWTTKVRGDAQASFLRRARVVEIGGERATILAPMDMLLHVCGHAGIGASPGNWAWIADAAMIQRHHAPTMQDWSDLVRSAAEIGIALPLAARLNYLAAEIGLPIPPPALTTLAEAACRSSRRERDATISQARAASGVPFIAMLKQSGWRSRLDLTRWALRRSPRFAWTRRARGTRERAGSTRAPFRAAGCSNGSASGDRRSRSSHWLTVQPAEKSKRCAP
jgi:Uncharacterised nucleotidyltransferase